MTRMMQVAPGSIAAKRLANARLIAAAPALLEAVEQFQRATRGARRDVRKDFSLLLADVAAAKAIAIVEGKCTL